jgi:hypothetical protein
MRDIALIKLRRQASSRQPRAGRAWIAAASTCAVMLSLCLSGHTALGAGSLPVGHCRLVLRLSVAPTRRHHVASGYKSSSGTSSCTGSLGPWLMGGNTGWSTSAGTFMNVAVQNRRVTANGRGSFWAEAPRRAWLHPPMVTFIGAFHLHRIHDSIELDGSGRLVPTREAPLVASFTFTGTATLTLHHRHASPAKRTTGTLTINFAVRDSS